MHTSYSPLQTAAAIHVPSSRDPGEVIDQRLVVIMLEADEEAVLASRILVLAGTRYQHVLLLGVCPDPLRQTELRRKLVTIAAFLRQQRLPAESHLSQSLQSLSVEITIERGRDWIERIKTVLQPDDEVACYDAQNVGRQPKPLCDILSSELEFPIYVLSDLRPSGPARQQLLSQATSWLGSIAAIGAFFLLQARIAAVVQGWAQSCLLLVTLFAEVSIVWIWNSLFT
jgi:hypothetical protein